MPVAWISSSLGQAIGKMYYNIVFEYPKTGFATVVCVNVLQYSADHPSKYKGSFGVVLSRISKRAARYLPATGIKIEDDILKWVNASVARGDGNEGSTAVNHYKKWCVARGDRILRPLDPLLTLLEVKVREVLRMARFALFLVQHQGVSASSASGYISTINAWHERRAFVKLAAGAPMSISSALLKGWARSHPPPGEFRNELESPRST